MNLATDPFITAGGFRFQLPANLESALGHLRLPHKDRLLWCDAICINQLDASEKAMQVARMHEIYRDAGQVLVWLGEEDEDSRLAIDTINRCVKKMMSSDGGVVSLQEMQQIRPDFLSDLPAFKKWVREKHLVLNDGPFGPRPWVACSRLARRPWFDRLWVRVELLASYHH